MSIFSFIKDKLGIRPPIMSQKLEHKLCMLFVEIEKQYNKHCPDDRVNFLNYYYVLYKLCELLGETYFFTLFPNAKRSNKEDRARCYLEKNMPRVKLEVYTNYLIWETD